MLGKGHFGLMSGAPCLLLPQELQTGAIQRIQQRQRLYVKNLGESCSWSWWLFYPNHRTRFWDFQTYQVRDPHCLVSCVRGSCLKSSCLCNQSDLTYTFLQAGTKQLPFIYPSVAGRQRGPENRVISEQGIWETSIFRGDQGSAGWQRERGSELQWMGSIFSSSGKICSEWCASGNEAKRNQTVVCKCSGRCNEEWSIAGLNNLL